MGRKQVIVGAVIGFGLLVFPVGAAFAAEDSTTSIVSGVINDTISVGVSGDVTISVIPTSLGSIATGSHNVTVNTNNVAGYHLQLASNTASSNLVKTDDPDEYFSPAQGDFDTPAVLLADTWGYRVDSFASDRYAAVPATLTPDTIKTSGTIAVNDVTPVTYAINATTAKPNGEYNNVVRYTAITN